MLRKIRKRQQKKINLSINSCQFIAIVFGSKIQIKGKHVLEYFLIPEKSHTGRSNELTKHDFYRHVV